jgi:hypothetical protein
MVEALIVGFICFMLVGWPMLTYAGDALRYLLWKLKEVGNK